MWFSTQIYLEAILSNADITLRVNHNTWILNLSARKSDPTSNMTLNIHPAEGNGAYFQLRERGRIRGKESAGLPIGKAQYR